MFALVAMQGCDADLAEASADFFMANGPLAHVNPRAADRAIGIHEVGEWRQQPDSSVVDAFQKADGSLLFDSCSDHMIDTQHVCSGRGTCEPWDPDDIAHPLLFCRCEDGWAGPECRTPRKSQLTTFAWSVVGGWFGADMFYLGFTVVGVVKLFTLGGLGYWWLMDIIRIGCGPVYTNGQYRTANDLPFYAFVVSVISFALALGFAIFIIFVLRPHVLMKRKAHGLRPFSQEEAVEVHRSRPNVHFDKVKHLLQGRVR
jgi:TM2 domain-containing membrane protein YozV